VTKYPGRLIPEPPGILRCGGVLRLRGGGPARPTLLGLPLRELADGKVYSELSTLARTAKDPAKKAAADALVQTAFRGEILRGMLNQAWAFSIFGSVAFYAGMGLALVTLIVLGALAFELFFAKKPIDEPVRTPALAPTQA
jgi:hypothetical protein